ncbi:MULTISPECIES: hypothetical protein [unclassified Kitasatospora]|uniref:hypothetical protein n=1 Tax=unclassified Kitasatospora TaxID=2633591 RepID=UPI003403F0F9
MGVVEPLVHGWDLAGAFGLGWQPPEHLAGSAVAGLFPEAPTGHGHADTPAVVHQLYRPPGPPAPAGRRVDLGRPSALSPGRHPIDGGGRFDPGVARGLRRRVRWV